MKPRIQYEHTKQTHPAQSTVKGLRKEMNALMAHQRQFEAAVRTGVQGALDQLTRGEVLEAKLTLVALRGIVG